MNARKAGGHDVDEQVAREEISRFYADRLAIAQQAAREAAEQLAAVEAAVHAWVERGDITPIGRYGNPDERQAAAYLHIHLLSIVADSESRHHAALRDVLGSALDAPPGMAAAELARVHDDPSTPAKAAEAAALGERTKALRRWLATQGHRQPGVGPLPDGITGRRAGGRR